MKLMSLKRISVAAALALVCTFANAGTFVVRGYGAGLDTRTVDVISDLVTEEFTRTFDAKKYGIVVHYSHIQIGNDNVCYAMTGVSRNVPDSRNQAIPAWSTKATYLIRNAGNLDGRQRQECVVSAIRAAIKDLMSTDPELVKSRSTASL
ncbi:hypothetical protein Cmtc_18830 [Cupriavidus sp. TKC]|uniref:hypothetical protein n=1 Tax=Cupriavidus sp. TKC TaxID=2880159 RepID=UPI0025A81908|nr:hypothetical protein [Cupriavidus sp. TKC]GMG90663.1 hypothetical protein Cmtc_18830 [Cupriavidus sp. TKC]